MKQCTTHHYACDCREELIRIVCQSLIGAHGMKCACIGCEAARKLIRHDANKDE